LKKIVAHFREHSLVFSLFLGYLSARWYSLDISHSFFLAVQKFTIVIHLFAHITVTDSSCVKGNTYMGIVLYDLFRFMKLFRVPTWLLP
jgi:hypothetical protein